MDKRELITFFLAALVARMTFVLAYGCGEWAHSPLFEGDVPFFEHYVAETVESGSFQLGLPVYSPLFLELLELANGLGQWQVLVRGLQVLLSSMAVAMLAATLAREGRPTLARWSAVAGVFSFGSLQVSTTVSLEGCYEFFLLAAICLGTPRSRKRPGGWFLLGGAHAVAYSLRPEHCIFALAHIVLMLRCRGSRGAVLTAALIVVGAAVALSVAARGRVQRFNETPYSIEADRLELWDASGREWLAELPGTVADDVADFVEATSGGELITLELASRSLRSHFGVLPEALQLPVLYSIKGPLDCALANLDLEHHGFSLAPLVRGGGSGDLSVSNPYHNHLLNNGLALAAQHVRDEPAAYFQELVGRLHSVYMGAVGGYLFSGAPYRGPVVRARIDSSIPIQSVWNNAVAVVTLVLLVLGAFEARRSSLIAACILAVAYRAIVATVFYGYARHGATSSLLAQPLVVAGLGLLAPTLLSQRLSQRLRAKPVVYALMALGLFAPVIGPTRELNLTQLDSEEFGEIRWEGDRMYYFGDLRIEVAFRP